jgi:CDP-diacylglycerol--serine O-phosphatidyltransferase
LTAKQETSDQAKRFRLLKGRRRLDSGERAARRERRRERRQQSLKVLPSLFTMANAVCGFAAIVHVAAMRYDPGTGQILNPEYLGHAGWLLLLAMVFDALDGRIARMTNTTSDVGGELDSLCDAVSFGVAPAMIVVMTNARDVSSNPLWWKFAWISGLVFVCGAIFRLARFNVETTSHDEEAHTYFKGLPSPAAAGTIATLAILQAWLRNPSELSGLFAQETLTQISRGIGYVLPFAALLTGWLMVSTVRYVHFGNRFLRGRRKIGVIARSVIVALVVFAILPELAFAATFLAFTLSGPIVSALRRGKHPDTEATDDASDFDESEEFDEQDLDAEAASRRAAVQASSDPAPQGDGAVPEIAEVAAKG